MTARRSPQFLLVLLAYAGFVSLGLPDAVLGIAWPSLRAAFGLSQAGLGWLLAAGASGYFLSGLFAGRLIERFGVGSLLFGSTVLVVAGVVGYALAPLAAAFAGAAIVVGWGSGAIDSGLNAYAARQFRAGQMAWLHAAWGAGAALGSFTMAEFVARGGGVRGGYGALAACLALLAVAFFFTRSLWSNNGSSETAAPSLVDRARPVGTLEALGMGRVQLGALTFFVYSGVEMGMGQWAYSVLVQARGFSASSAGLAVSAYWASLFCGRILTGFIVERVGSVRLVRLGAVLAALGACAFAAAALPDLVNAAGLVLVGLAIAPIYPGLMSETPRRMGAAATHAVGFQVSAAVAGLVALPALGGLIAERVGLEGTAAFVAGCAALLLVLHEIVTRVPEIRHDHDVLDTRK